MTSEAIDITGETPQAEEERKILKGIVKFGDIEAKETKGRTSRPDTALNFKEMLKVILDGYSRVPAYTESLTRFKAYCISKTCSPTWVKMKDLHGSNCYVPLSSCRKAKISATCSGKSRNARYISLLWWMSMVVPPAC